MAVSPAPNEAAEKVVFVFLPSYRSIACELEFQENRFFYSLNVHNQPRPLVGVGCIVLLGQVVKAGMDSRKTFFPNSAHIWMTIPRNCDRLFLGIKAIGYAAVLIPCSLQASPIFLCQKWHDRINGCTVLQEGVGQSKKGGLIFSEGSDFCSEVGLEVCNWLSYSIPSVARESKPVMNKPCKTTSSGSQKPQITTTEIIKKIHPSMRILVVIIVN